MRYSVVELRQNNRHLHTSSSLQVVALRCGALRHGELSLRCLRILVHPLLHLQTSASQYIVFKRLGYRLRPHAHRLQLLTLLFPARGEAKYLGEVFVSSSFLASVPLSRLKP